MSPVNIQQRLSSCKLVPIIACILLLCACQQQPSNLHTLTTPQNSAEYLLTTPHWQFKGRVAFQDREQCHFASITWQQHDADYDIFISNPLAAQSLHLTPANIHSSFLTDLPTEQLRYWLHGLPCPEIPIETAIFDQQNQLIILKQAGWSIHYPSYAPFQSITLPQKIIATKDDIRIKLNIQSRSK